MTAREPVAIVDIGSNSVRLVVYSGARRVPSVLFNEKVSAGLGRGLAETGRLDPAGRERALAALARFRRLVGAMGVVRTRIVATAAAREAEDGAAFLEEVRALGFDPRIVSGEEEGRLAGLGVASAVPGADGVAGDLGGGSLELVELAKGDVGRSVSLPLGILRLGALAARGRRAFRDGVAEVVAAAGFAGSAEGRGFYLIGGSWRALARLDLALADHPLPATHQHSMTPARPAELLSELERLGKAELRAIPSISSSRIATLPDAALLLDALASVLAPARLVVSSFGIREGLLFDELSAQERALDPLVEAAREAGAGLGRFAQHGGLLDRWIAPAFDDGPAEARLRLAACMLADIAWAAHPEFRAERGIDMALHGNWVAIDARGRALLAQALFVSFGGGGDLPYRRIAALCDEKERSKAIRWGLAMRLGQRLSGGVAGPLERSRLVRGGGALRLELGEGDGGLLGEAVERRLKALAQALGLRAETRAG